MQTIINMILSDIQNITIWSVVDILVVAFIFYKGYMLIKETRAEQLLKGILLILILIPVSYILKLDILYFILSKTITIGVIAVIIIFQPEIRRGLEHIGRSTFDDFHIIQNDEEIEKVITNICEAVENMAKTKTGALIAIEQGTGLGDIVSTGIKMDSLVSRELIENIFVKNTPLHDGATIIKNDRILASACVLPLTNNNNISKQLGTRHRAAIGLSEASDALIIIVSEETGAISLAIKGRLTRNFDGDKLKSILLKIVKEKNLMVKLVCLLLSFGLWIYISNIENPIKQYTITNIPVQIVNLDVLKEDNLTLAPDQNFTISLTIQGTSTNIYSINKSQFTVVANLSNYTLKSGDNSIPVEITNSPNNVNIKNNGVLRINIKLENITEKTMPVKSELNVTTSNSTYVKNISFSTNQITVSGPEETVNEVSKLVVRGNVTANNSTTTASFPVVAVDSSGNVVNDVVLSTNNVQTTITVEKGKLVPIKVQTTGELRAGLTLENIIANPNTIKILGSESVLDSTDEILSEPINLNSITGNETIITNLIVPRNITLLPNENEINVDVKVSGADENNSENVINGNTETTKTFEIPITIEGNLSGYTANLSSNTVTVVLKGAKKELDNLQASNLSCKIDISKLTKEGGVVSPTVDINNENNVLVDSQNPQTVDVTFTKAEE